MTVSVKAYRRGKELLIAASDSDILDKTFRSGELKIHVSKEFYGGDVVDVDVFLSRLAMATVANLVGEETVGAAVEHGFVDPGCIVVIGGVPHAQMARMI